MKRSYRPEDDDVAESDNDKHYLEPSLEGAREASRHLCAQLKQAARATRRGASFAEQNKAERLRIVQDTNVHNHELQYDTGGGKRFSDAFSDAFSKGDNGNTNDFESGGVLPRSDLSTSTDGSLSKYHKWQTKHASIIAPKHRALSVSSNMGLFAMLPGELRNHIYHVALAPLDDGLNELIVTGQPHQCSRGPCMHVRVFDALPGLLSVCRQIRTESLPFLLEGVVLRFDARTVRQRCTANYLNAIGPAARMLKGVILEIEVTDHIRRGSNLQVSKTHRMRIFLGKAPDTAMKVLIGAAIESRSKETDAVEAHLARLNQLAHLKTNEQLLLEFVGSDALADLVYACSTVMRV